MTVVVDYGVGNIGSIVSMLRKIGADVTVANGPKDILEARRLILPGVGSFDAGMQGLQRKGYVEVLEHKVQNEGIPILGICLGAQLLTRGSEEGKERGLGWIEANCRRFQFQNSISRLKVPNMSWLDVRIIRTGDLFPDMAANTRFYFVHSYHICCDHARDVVATAEYGIEFTAAVVVGNVMGVQFHPEKSHRFGMVLLKRFIQCTSASGDAAGL